MPNVPMNKDEAAAKDQMEQALMQKMGEGGPPQDQSDGTDGGEGQQLMQRAMQAVQLPDANAAFQAAGLTQPSPQMQQIWQTLNPQQRIAIFETISSSGGMAGDDEMQEAAQSTTAPVAPDPQQELLDKMGVK